MGSEMCIRDSSPAGTPHALAPCCHRERTCSSGCLGVLPCKAMRTFRCRYRSSFAPLQPPSLLPRLASAGTSPCSRKRGRAQHDDGVCGRHARKHGKYANLCLLGLVLLASVLCSGMCLSLSELGRRSSNGGFGCFDSPAPHPAALRALLGRQHISPPGENLPYNWNKVRQYWYQRAAGAGRVLGRLGPCRPRRQIARLARSTTRMRCRSRPSSSCRPTSQKPKRCNCWRAAQAGDMS